MNKIYLLILLLAIVLFTVNYKKLKVEHIKNTKPVKTIQRCYQYHSGSINNIQKHSVALVNKLKIEPYLNSIIEIFKNINIQNKQQTIEQYLVSKNVPSNQINNCITVLEDILNNHNFSTQSEDYKIEKTSTVGVILNTWLFDNIRNSLLCITQDRTTINNIIEVIMKLILQQEIILCNKDKFIDYCSIKQKQYKNDKTIYRLNNKEKPDDLKFDEIIETFANKKFNQPIKKKFNQPVNKKTTQPINKKTIQPINKKTIQIVNKKTIQPVNKKTIQLVNKKTTQPVNVTPKPKNMNLSTIEQSLFGFNNKSFGSKLEKYLKDLMNDYQKIYSKNINMFIVSDINNLMTILKNKILNIIENVKKETQENKFKELRDDFYANRRIYYRLKFLHNLSKSYNQIKSLNLNANDYNNAIVCCAKNNKCFNFSVNYLQPQAVLYSSYINEQKCLNETPELIEVVKLQNKSLNNALIDLSPFWKTLDSSSQLFILENVKQLLEFYGSKSNNIGTIRRELNNNKDIKLIFQFIPRYKNNMANLFIIDNPDHKKISEQINNLKTTMELQRLMEAQGFSKENFVLGIKIKMKDAIDIVQELIFAKYLLLKFDIDSDPSIVLKLYGVINKNETFEEILMSTKIIPRMYDMIVNFLLTKLKNNNIANINSFTLKSKPNQVIRFTNFNLSDMSFDFCYLSGLTFEKFRRDRIISVEEYQEYSKLLNIYCIPNSIKTNDLDYNKIPLNPSLGLNVVAKSYPTYGAYVKEKDKIKSEKLNTRIVSDNINFDFIRNIYN
jgi:hypothetical protein